MDDTTLRWEVSYHLNKAKTLIKLDFPYDLIDASLLSLRKTLEFIVLEKLERITGEKWFQEIEQNITKLPAAIKRLQKEQGIKKTVASRLHGVRHYISNTDELHARPSSSNSTGGVVDDIDRIAADLEDIFKDVYGFPLHDDKATSDRTPWQYVRDALRYRGGIGRAGGDNRLAVEALREANNRFEHLDDNEGLATVAYLWACILIEYDQSDFDEEIEERLGYALSITDKSETLAPQILFMLAKYHLCRFSREEGGGDVDMRNALLRLSQCIEACGDTGESLFTLANALNTRGLAKGIMSHRPTSEGRELESDNRDEAILALQQSIQISDENGFDDLRAPAHNYLGRIHFLNKDYEKARRSQMQAISIGKRIGDRKIINAAEDFLGQANSAIELNNRRDDR